MPTLDGHTILVVEDDHLIAQELCRGLRREGAVVVGPVPSVSQSMSLLASTPGVDAAVLDVNLGEEKIFPVAQALEARGTPFIFATGYNSADIPPEWQHVTRLMKPVRMSVLAEQLASAATADVTKSS